jgi:hypothetical protein
VEFGVKPDGIRINKVVFKRRDIAGKELKKEKKGKEDPTAKEDMITAQSPKEMWCMRSETEGKNN